MRKINLTPFVDRPVSSLIICFLFVMLGFVSVSGLIPTAPNRHYFPYHEWVLAVIAWIAAILFLFCSYKGIKEIAKN